MKSCCKCGGSRNTFQAFTRWTIANSEIARGEVHALVGENGAGKSTMMKVLTGVYQMDAGEILLDGKPVQIHNTRDAQALGISIIHQD